MKKLGIIADTHLSETGSRGIPERIFKLFAGVDFILHAGDFTSKRALLDLETIAPVVGVRGNNDPAHLGLPRSRRFQVEGVVLGLCHGDRGAANNSWPKPLHQFRGNSGTAANAMDCFEFEEDVNALIFGHSHLPLCQWYQPVDRNILLFNPGSPTDKRFGPVYGCGLFVVNGDNIEPQLFTW